MLLDVTQGPGEAILAMLIVSPLSLTPALAALTPGTHYPLTCDPAGTRLAPDTNQLVSDCGYVAWCDTSTLANGRGTCRPNGCRRDTFPFGYGNGTTRDDWPRKCPDGQFCPDEMSGCLPLQAVGSACQLNRDDECAPPPTSQQGSSSVCLRYTCQYKNVTLGNECMHDNTLYTIYVSRRQDYGLVVSKDNCEQGLYCDSASSRCLVQQPMGSSCSSDKECLSLTCRDPSFTATSSSLGNTINERSGRCASPQEKRRIKIGVLAGGLLGVLVGLIVFSACLIRVHNAQRRRRIYKRRGQDARTASTRDAFLPLSASLASVAAAPSARTSAVDTGREPAPAPNGALTPTSIDGGASSTRLLRGRSEQTLPVSQ